MPLYDDLERRSPVRMTPSRGYTLGESVLGGARLGARGGGLWGATVRGSGAANEAELARLNQEFMADRARSRARQGLGGVTMEELGPNLAHHLTEEGRLRGGLGKYFPYADALPGSVASRLRLGEDAYSQMDPVTLRDGSKVYIGNTDLMTPEWLRLEEEALAANPAIQPPPESVAGRLHSAADTRIGATVRTSDGYAFTKVGPNSWVDSAGDMTMTDALMDTHSAPGQTSVGQYLSSDVFEPVRVPDLPTVGGWEPPGAMPVTGEFDPTGLGAGAGEVPASRSLIRGAAGLYTPDDLEELLYSAEKLRRAQVNPQFSGTPKGVRDWLTVAGYEPGTVDPIWAEGSVSDIDFPRSGISREVLELDKPTNWVKSQSDEVLEATRIRDMLGPLEGLGPTIANEAPVPSRLSRIGAGLKTGIKAALTPANIIKDATVGTLAGGLSTGLGTWRGRPTSAGTINLPPDSALLDDVGPEGVIDQASLLRIIESADREKEALRQSYVDQINVKHGPGTIGPGARIEQISEHLGPVRWPYGSLGR